MLTRLAIRRALHTTPRRSVAQPAAHTNTFDGIPSAREVMVDENLSEGKVKLALPVFVAGGSSLLGYVCYIQWRHHQMDQEARALRAESKRHEGMN